MVYQLHHVPLCNYRPFNNEPKCDYDLIVDLNEFCDHLHWM